MRDACVLLTLLWIAFALPQSARVHGQGTDPQPIDQVQAGAFLVAAPSMGDPRFRESVILVLEHDDSGTMGVIVNRITGVTLGQALPDWAELDRRKHFLFLGGPVQLTGLTYLHSAGASGGPTLWSFDGVRGGVDAPALRRLLEQDMPVDGLRVYLGYAGWGPGQLSSELERDDWHLFRADPALVFDPNPDTLWPLFITTLNQPWI